MLSIEKCNDILNNSENKYSKEKIVEIRAFLYQMAELINEYKKTYDQRLKR